MPVPAQPQPAPQGPPLASLVAWDLTGKRQPEVLFTQAKPAEQFPQGASPDGRYVFLVTYQGEYKGDYRAIPAVYDRKTNTVKGDKQLLVHGNAGVWSGHGFYVDWLTHADPAMQLDTYPALRKALELKEQEREIIAASFSADGRRFAALVGKRWADVSLSLDLVTANADGTGLITQAGAVKGWGMQIGNYALLSLSPDGSHIALMAEKPGLAIITVADPAPARWITLPAQPVSTAPVWAPDGKHVWVPRTGVVDLAGKVTLPSDQEGPGLWTPDGSALVRQTGPDAFQLAYLDGRTQPLPLPVQTRTVRGFLADGRALLWVENK